MELIQQGFSALRVYALVTVGSINLLDKRIKDKSLLLDVSTDVWEQRVLLTGVWRALLLSECYDLYAPSIRARLRIGRSYLHNSLPVQRKVAHRAALRRVCNFVVFRSLEVV